jgi:hypothetical protein
MHLPRCAPRKPPDLLRADDLFRPTTTPCNSQVTKHAQRRLSYITLMLERRPTFLPPTQLRGRLPPSSPPPPLNRSSCGRSHTVSSLPLPASISQQNLSTEYAAMLVESPFPLPTSGGKMQHHGFDSTRFLPHLPTASTPQRHMPRPSLRVRSSGCIAGRYPPPIRTRQTPSDCALSRGHTRISTNAST